MGHEDRRLSSYSFGEAKTLSGQSVSFSYPTDVKPELIRNFLEQNVRSVSEMKTGCVSLSHGGWGAYTRYDILQHKYAGSGPNDSGHGGYIELLEIKNPPDGRHGIVIHQYRTWDGGIFTEWETLEQAISAFETHWSNGGEQEKFKKAPGFKRLVHCGVLTPWFYAVGEQLIFDEYVFPEHLQENPVYRFGKKFVVTDNKGFPEIKTCMGSRLYKERGDHYPHKEIEHHDVYWDDGSKTSISSGNIRPLEEGEKLWTSEAVRQFKEMIVGKRTDVVINFIDGKKFVGKISGQSFRAKCAEGVYILSVKVKGEKKIRQGSVEFKPTKDSPDIVQYVTKKIAEGGKEVLSVEVCKFIGKKGGKKWSGLFFQE